MQNMIHRLLTPLSQPVRLNRTAPFIERERPPPGPNLPLFASLEPSFNVGRAEGGSCWLHGRFLVRRSRRTLELRDEEAEIGVWCAPGHGFADLCANDRDYSNATLILLRLRPALARSARYDSSTRAASAYSSSASPYKRTWPRQSGSWSNAVVQEEPQARGTWSCLLPAGHSVAPLRPLDSDDDIHLALVLVSTSCPFSFRSLYTKSLNKVYTPSPTRATTVPLSTVPRGAQKSHSPSSQKDYKVKQGCLRRLWRSNNLRWFGVFRQFTSRDFTRFFTELLRETEPLPSCHTPKRLVSRVSQAISAAAAGNGRNGPTKDAEEGNGHSRTAVLRTMASTWVIPTPAALPRLS